MPRYLIERTYEGDSGLPMPNHSEQSQELFLGNNTLFGVVWIYSYVSPDKKKSFCLYEAPSPEALRRASQINHLPVDQILEVRMFSPYLFAEQESRPSDQ